MRTLTITTPNKMAPRTMENAQEFGEAGKGGKLLYTAFYRELRDMPNQLLMGRLVTRLMKVIKSDPVHGRGQRTLAAGDLRLLEGFDFHSRNLLQRILPVRPEVTVHRQPGSCVVSIPSFVPQDELYFRSRVTHIRLTAAAAFLDFDRESCCTQRLYSEPLPVQSPAAVTLSFSLPAMATPLPLVVVAGIRLLQLVNGRAYAMREGMAVEVVKAV